MKSNAKNDKLFDVSKMTDNHDGTFTDENGGTWTKDGMFVLNECQPGSMMDFVNRLCNGEELPPPNDGKEDSGK